MKPNWSSEHPRVYDEITDFSLMGKLKRSQIIIKITDKNKMQIAYKIIGIIVALVVITQFLSPLLVPLLPPFGILILIVLYLVVVGYAIGWLKIP